MEKEQLLKNLKQQGIQNPKVLEAIGHVPREYFVVHEFQEKAYENIPLPLGLGQTISQPFIVAYMTEQLMPVSGQKILEIGTGSGYQAAILSELGAEVYSIERIPELAHQAEQALSYSGYQSVHIKIADGYDGWPNQAPFNAIIVTATSDTGVPKRLVEQLALGGKMIIPIRIPMTYEENLYLITRHENDEIESKKLISVRFVPFV